MIIENTKKIMKEDNVYAKKKYGQNFLIDKTVLNDIVIASSISKDDYIIEIGPGLGTLTEKLCEKANKVLCYEIDRDLALKLPNRLKHYSNYKIINNDFLDCNIEEDVNNFFGVDAKKIKLIANIPYNITTPIILKVLKEKKIDYLVLMVQKELGERFSCAPKCKEYGSITVFLTHLGRSSIERTVGRLCFEPAPNVESVVYKFVRNKNEYDEDYLLFLRNSFNQKRKKLSNNLSSAYNINKKQVEQFLLDKGISSLCRAEELSDNEFYDLYLSFRCEQWK